MCEPFDPLTISFSLVEHSQPTPRWHPGLTLLFALSGEWTVRLTGRSYPLRGGGLLALSPFRLYRLDCGAPGLLLVWSVPEAYLELVEWGGRPLHCYAPSDADGAQAQLSPVRQALARAYAAYAEPSGGYLALVQRTAPLLEYLLCRVAVPTAPLPLSRLESALQYLWTHWREKPSVAQLARQNCVSANYLSHLFQKKLGLSATGCLNAIRLCHAAADLLGTGASVAEIALRCGFRDAGAFAAAFRAAYGLTPAKYRLQGRPRAQRSAVPAAALQPYTVGREDAPALSAGSASSFLQFNAAVEGRALPHRWREQIDLGRLYGLLDARTQQIIARAQNELPFTYARVHGLFDAELQLTPAKGALHFALSDLAVDFLLAHGLRPLWVIQADGETTEQRGLLCRILRHWMERYGLSALRQWRFTVPMGAAADEWLEAIRSVGAPLSVAIETNEKSPPLAAESCEQAGRMIHFFCETQECGWLSLCDAAPPDAQRVFSGGPGLFTANGLPKCGWLALGLLSRLGGELIGRGPGYMAARRQNDVQLLLYPASDTALPVDLTLECAGLPAGRYRLHCRTVGPEHGSVYEAWRRMGAPEPLTEGDLSYLARLAQPHRRTEILTVNDSLIWRLRCAPGEIHLIELHGM